MRESTVLKRIVKVLAERGGSEWNMNISRKLKIEPVELREFLIHLRDMGVLFTTHEGRQQHLLLRKFEIDFVLPDLTRRVYPTDATIDQLRERREA